MSAPALDRLQRIKAIVGASSGNLVEWFDFYTYAFCSLYFAGAFFPSHDKTTQLLNTAAVFAVGFLMRPLGGWLFGRLADRRGRRASMLMAILLMCGGSLIIACLPTYEQVGVWAPAGLLVARLLQGLSVGGEYGTSATYMSEVAVRGERGFLASFQAVTLIGGQLLALLVVVILQACLSDDALRAWGWRIPFVLGALAALVSLTMRRSLRETAPSEALHSRGAGTLRTLLQHKGAVLCVVGYTAGGSLSFYTFTTYMQKYLVNTAGLAARSASLVMTCAICVYMLLQPLFGALSDRVGRRTMMMSFGVGMAVLTYPIMTVLRHVSSPWVAGVLVVVALGTVSLYTSIGGLIKAEMFPVEVRGLGVGLSYALANAVFGGSAEFVALELKGLGLEDLFFVYVSLVCALGILFSRRIPRPGEGLLE